MIGQRVSLPEREQREAETGKVCPNSTVAECQTAAEGVSCEQ